ncbi:MAG: hypothetical protein ACUVT0_11215 [Thermochromatium sp.]
MHDYTEQPQNTFVVRFWRDFGADAPRWHGHVRHIQSGDQVSFADEATLMEFMHRWVMMHGNEEERPAGRP